MPSPSEAALLGRLSHLARRGGYASASNWLLGWVTLPNPSEPAVLGDWGSAGKKLAALAHRARMPALSAFLAGLGRAERWEVPDTPSEAPAPDVDTSETVLEVDPYHQTEAARRKANLAALAILRAKQAERQKPTDPLPRATASERAALRQYSGWGGIDINRLSLAEAQLLGEDQAEYLRLSAERAQVAERVLRQTGRKAREADLPSYGKVRGAFAGMIDQYFTPVEVAAGMVEWATRVYEGVNGGSRPRRLLEPSAGIGRFLRAYQRLGLGGAPHWEAVELDPDLADMLRLLYTDVPGGVPRWGEVNVTQGAFEQFAAAHPFLAFDAVVGNPPYAKRGRWGKVDPDGQKWEEEAHYFLWRSMEMLSTRGVMCHIVPAGLLNGKDGASRQIREALLLEGHLAAAVIPPYEIFPGALLNLCISVWIKRPSPLKAVLPEDREILEGRYFDLPEHQQGIMGVPQGGHYRPEAITGTWDVERMRRQPIRVPPASLFERPREVAASVRLEDMRTMTGGVVDALSQRAEILGARVAHWRRLVDTQPEAARAGQAELLSDLKAFSADGLAQLRKQMTRPPPLVAALLSVYDIAGAVTGSIAQAVANVTTGYQGDRDPASVARWLVSRQEDATVEEVNAYAGAPSRLEGAVGARSVALALESDLYWWVDPERGLVFQRREEFLSGACWAKLDYCRGLVDGRQVFPGATRETLPRIVGKAAAQAEALLEVIRPVPLGEIDLSLRSQFVHERALGSTTFDAPMIRDFLREVKGVPLDRVHYEEGWLVAEGVNALHLQVARVLDYCNRQSAGGRGESLEDKLAADEQLDAEYSAFVRAHDHASKVEDRYNRSYRSWVRRTYATDALPMARLSPEASGMIRPYAWSAVRRAVEREGGIMSLDVGLGKTVSALLTLARLRQQGRIRRPVIAVPNSVGPNWLEEVALWLPDWRAILVGATVVPRAEGGIVTVPDDEATVVRKLQAFASGQFDCAVIQHSTFDRLGVDVEAMRSHFRGRFAAARDIALEKRQIQADEERLKSMEEGFAQAFREGKKDEAQAIQDRIDRMQGAPWAEKLRADLQAIEDKLEKGSLSAAQERELKKQKKRVEAQVKKYAKKQTISDRKRQTDQQRLDAWIEERLEGSHIPIRGVLWEELGVDFLVIDEAHEYKNLFGPASRHGKRPKYIGALSEDDVIAKAWGCYSRCALVRARTGRDSGVLLLTATPLKNSPLEAYNLLSYVTSTGFERRGILSAEDFLDRYAKPESEPVLTVDGSFREDLAVRRFTNLHELRGLFDTYVDVRVALPPDEYEAAKREGRPLDNVVQLPLPRAVYQTLYIPMNREQEEVYQRHRQDAAQAAEAAAAKLCQREVQRIEDTIGSEAAAELSPTLLLVPEWRSLPLARRFRILYAIALQHPSILKGGAPGYARHTWWQEMARQVERGSEGAESLLMVLWDQLAAHLEEARVKAGLKLDDKRLGALGAEAGEAKAPRRKKAMVEEGSEEGGGKEEEKENLLKIMNEMSMAAVDVRLLFGRAALPPPKYIALAERVRNLPGCGHIVFADYSEIHPWVMDALERDAGVPRSRMISVTGELSPGERQDVARRLNGDWDAEKGEWRRAPELDVVIGTKAIEQGMNLQKRSCAIHHLTFPWEPATIQQRNGRAVRQGNRLKEVFIFYYVADKSFDGYRLSLIINKRGWMRELLESANRATNNPGAELMGPCSVLRQLSADPERAEEFCKCLENAASLKALAQRKDKAAADFASLVAHLASARQPGPQQAYYAGEAEKLREKLRATEDEVFPRKDLIDQAESTPLYWEPKSGAVFIQDTPVCISDVSVWVEQVDLKNKQVRLRRQGSWFPVVYAFGDLAERLKGKAGQSCDWSALDDTLGLSKSDELRPGNFRLVDPVLYELNMQAALDSLERSYGQLPWVDESGNLRVGRVYDRDRQSAPWRLLTPWAEGAEEYLALVRRASPWERKQRRAELSGLYALYFGRTYPADLLRE